MKSLQNFCVAAVASRGVRFLQRSAFSGIVLASLLVSIDAYGQGQYYPVTNPGGPNVSSPGTPYGGAGSYSGITVHSNASLQAMQGSLTTLYNAGQLPPGGGPGIPTLQVPIPAGSRAPTTAEYAAAVGATMQGELTNPGNFAITVTPNTIASEAIAWSPANRGATVDMIAKVVISNNPSTAAGILSQIVDALAKSPPTLPNVTPQPGLIDTILPNILNDLAGVGQGTAPITPPTYFGQNLAVNWSANTTTAQGIPQVVNTVVSDIPRDLTRIASVVGSGLAAINSAPASILTSAQKGTLYTGAGGMVPTLFAGSAASNPAVIDALSKAVTSPSFVGVGGTTLSGILTAAKAVLPATNSALGALADGALRSQAGSGAVGGTIDTTLATPYTTALVTGYSNSSSSGATASGAPTAGSLSATVAANPALADAVAQGATVKGTLSTAIIVQDALSYGSGTPPKNIVAAVVGANLAQAVSTTIGAINTGSSSVTINSIVTPAHMPWGGAGFGDLAYGAAIAAPLELVGGTVQALVQYSAANTASLTSGTVNTILDQAIHGATDGSKTGAYAAIIYQAENVGRNTSGVSGPLTTQAVTSLTAVSGPLYLGMVAALAGDSGANFATIKSAGDTALTSSPSDKTAADGAATLIQNLRSNSSKTFTNTISAFNTAATTGPSPTSNVLADVYAAVLANPSEADAGLASAIKQSGVSDVTLTSVADDAYRVTNSNSSVAANLVMVETVVDHIKNENTGVTGTSIEDLFDFVGHQIVTNSALTKDIAIAATIVDPDGAHFIAHSVAFNNPTAVSGMVAPIFEYAQINNPTPLAVPTVSNPSGALPANYTTGGPKTFPGATKGAIIDQPAAAAAITAGLVTGIIEANLDGATPNQSSTTAAFPNTTAVLTATVSAAVAASVAQNGTLLVGPAAGHVFNSGATGTGFQQMITSGSGTTVTTQTTYGAAGAITGYIAQVTVGPNPGYNPSYTGDSTISAITAAVLKAAVGGSARNYAMQIAQAAGQALRWVGGGNVSTAAAGSLAPGNPSYDIAFAMSTTVAGFASLSQLEAAVSFGISQAAAGVIGAGALGLNTTSGTGLNTGTPSVADTGNVNSQFYIHRSAAGTPVTDIFNL